MKTKLPPILPEDNQTSLERNSNLLRIFEDIHNHIYANDGLSPEQALEETIKILFVKIFDEKTRALEFKIRPSEYTTLLAGKLSTEFINRFGLLQQKAFNYFPRIFEPNEKIKLKSPTLAYVVNKLQNIDLLKSSDDVKGLAFQKFIHSSQKIGRGQFFTPEQVIKLCVDIIKPHANEKILDPACGSAGFLSYALKNIQINDPARSKNFAQNNIYGIEINSMVSKIAKMRMILDGDGFSNITQEDSLSDWSDIDLAINTVTEKDEKTYKEYFDIVLTNPPFGTQGRISNESVLKNYNLGYKWIKESENWVKSNEFLNGQVPEILFIERCLEFLKPGGRMAIVLPNGNFENSSLEYLRYFILQKADILAVIKLPQETFIPSGTGVKTSLLFLQKKGGKKLSKKIFFGNVNSLGYLGNKNGSQVYRKDNKGNYIKDSFGNLLVDEDYSQLVNVYNNFEKGSLSNQSDNYFFVDRSDFSQLRFDYEFYKPYYRNLINSLTKEGSASLGDIVTLKKEKSKKLKQKDLVVNYIELSDVSSQYNEIINASQVAVHELPSRASYELEYGEIITAVAGNSIGTSNHVSAIVTNEYHGAICTNGFRVLKPNLDKINPYYLLYFLKSDYFLKQVYRFRTGAAIPSLSDTDLLNIVILLPSKNEQERIGNVIKRGFEERNAYREMIEKVTIEL